MGFTKKQVNHVIHAFKNNDFYIQLAKSEKFDIDKINLQTDWNKVPIITKKMLLENEECIINHEYIALLYEGKLSRTYTSGSAGDFVEVYWRQEDYNHSLFPLWTYRLKEYGIKPDDRLCYFYTTKQPGKEENWYEYTKSRLGFCKSDINEKRLQQIYEKIYDFSPKWLLLQPSMVSLLCMIKRKFQLPDLDNLRYIELTGELLTEDLRKEIENVFSCPVVNQYGSNEVNSIAYECKNKHFHVMEQNVYVEILDESNTPVFDKEGEICVTSFVNKAMPIIRYKIGDRGIIRTSSCSCNMAGRILELTKARSNDWIILEQGIKVSPYTLLKIIENINWQTDNGIYQFRFIQKSTKEIIVKLVLDEDIFSEDVENLFFSNLSQNNLRKINYIFEYYDYIPINENTGKLAWFESEVRE